MFDVFYTTTCSRYIENCVATVDNNNALKDQLQLIYQQFLFERHRRETHAYRNRRLLSDAKNTRLLEEYNSALVRLHSRFSSFNHGLTAERPSAAETEGDRRPAQAAGGLPKRDDGRADDDDQHDALHGGQGK